MMTLLDIHGLNDVCAKADLEHTWESIEWNRILESYQSILMMMDLSQEMECLVCFHYYDLKSTTKLRYHIYV